jgi:hypothetical protein
MGIRNLLARLPLLGRDVLLTYAVVLGMVYALPIYAVVRSGPPTDAMGWGGLIVWAWVGRWFVKGLIFGGFNGTDEDLAADVDRRDVNRRNVDRGNVDRGSVEALAATATATTTTGAADVAERPQR